MTTENSMPSHSGAMERTASSGADLIRDATRIEAQGAPSYRGEPTWERTSLKYKGLSKEAKWAFFQVGKTGLARFYESLKHAGFNGGEITYGRAKAYLSNCSESFIRRALKDSDAFQVEYTAQIQALGLGEFFSRTCTPSTRESENKILKETSPATECTEDVTVSSSSKKPRRSHKKGKGTGKKEGRREKSHFIPPTWAIDALFSNSPHYCEFDVNALASNMLWNIAVATMHLRGVKNKKGTCKREAARVGACEQTLRKWHRLAKIGRKPWKGACRLSPREIARLPVTVTDYSRGLRSKRCWIKWVFNLAGEYRMAFRDAIMGNYAGKASFQRTGEIQRVAPLPGPLYAIKRLGVLFTDEGGSGDE